LIQISYPYLVEEEMMMIEVFFQCLIAPINGNHPDHLFWWRVGWGRVLPKLLVAALVLLWLQH